MQWSLESISALMLEAAQLALQHRDMLEVQEKNTNFSTQNEIYTNVDTEVEQLLSNKLAAPNEHHYVLGEETAEETLLNNNMESLFSKTTWVIDPIDGTRNFANGLPLWGISVGYIENLEFKEGAIIFPDLQECMISYNGNVYYYTSPCSFLSLSAINISDFKELKYTPIQHNHRVWAASNAQQIQRAATKYNAHIARSCVYSIAKVLTNNFFAYIGKAKIWDFAACIALFRNIQKEVYYHSTKTNTLEILPWQISDTFWSNNLTAIRRDLVFCHEYNLGMCILPNSKSASPSH